MGDKNLLCDFLNYISHCVYLLYKAIKQTVFVVCTVELPKYFIIQCLFVQNITGEWGRYTKNSGPHSPTYRGSTVFDLSSYTRNFYDNWPRNRDTDSTSKL